MIVELEVELPGVVVLVKVVTVKVELIVVSGVVFVIEDDGVKVIVVPEEVLLGPCDDDDGFVCVKLLEWAVPWLE